MPQVPNSMFLSAPHCFHPTDGCSTCFYTVSRHNGVLIQEGGATPKSHDYYDRCHSSRTGPSRRVTVQAASTRTHPGLEGKEERTQKENKLSQTVSLATHLGVAITHEGGHFQS